LRRAVDSEPVNGAEENQSVKNDEQRKDYPNRNPNLAAVFPSAENYPPDHLPRAFYPMDCSGKSNRIIPHLRLEVVTSSLR